MSSTKDVDLKAQAREKAEELRLAKLIAEYDPKDDGIIPPEIAPREYAITALDPSSYPLSLAALSSKYGGSGNLLSLLGKTVDVPTSPPIAMSDFAGKGLNYRFNGRINIDRYADLTGDGLFPKPSATWDRNDGTFFPANEPQVVGGGGWNNCLINSYEFLVTMIEYNWKVTNVRTLQMNWRVKNTDQRRIINWIGLYGPSFSDLTYTYGSVGTFLGVNQYSLDLVVGGVPQDPIMSQIGTTSQRMDAVRSHIEGGFGARLNFQHSAGLINRLTDYHMIADFDVAPR